MEGPVFEVTGFKVLDYDITCYVNVSDVDPDSFDLTLVADGKFVRAARHPPRQCPRLFLFNDEDVLNPARR
jgi:hypothetical protein